MTEACVRTGALVLITYEYPFKDEGYIGHYGIILGSAIVGKRKFFEYKLLVGEEHVYVMTGEFEVINT